jgi:hypothetical protein
MPDDRIQEGPKYVAEFVSVFAHYSAGKAGLIN